MAVLLMLSLFCFLVGYGYVYSVGLLSLLNIALMVGGIYSIIFLSKIKSQCYCCTELNYLGIFLHLVILIAVSPFVEIRFHYNELMYIYNFIGFLYVITAWFGYYSNYKHNYILTDNNNCSSQQDTKSE